MLHSSARMGLNRSLFSIVNMNIVLNGTEYIGNVPAEKREEVIQQLNKEVERLVKVSYCPVHLHTDSLSYDYCTGCSACEGREERKGYVS